MAEYLADKLPRVGKSLEPLPTTTTHRNGDPQRVTWESIDSEAPGWLAAEVRQFSTRFGYEL